MRSYLIPLFLLALLGLAACSGAGSAAQSDPPPATAAPATDPAPSATAGQVVRPSWAGSDWQTNFAIASVDFGELRSGGPPRDGIPSIDAPQFVSQAAAAEWLAGNEPVIALEIDGDARAYPLQILTWHEIANDTVGDVPVAVTFCPLCNAAVVFDRRLDGEIYEFGVSGLLRNSDLVMYDRTTESLWQQFTGAAIIGDLTGRQLEFVPSTLISFADFQAAYPDGTVLSRETGFDRQYGRNPYVGYDQLDQRPFLFDGPFDERLQPMERVIALEHAGVPVAYPLTAVAAAGVINDAARDLVVFFNPGKSSALDAASIAEGRDVGAATVFTPRAGDRQLTFAIVDGAIIDEQTGSTWNIVGQAIDGPLAGEQLAPVVHAPHFWFAWAAFEPETEVYGVGE